MAGTSRHTSPLQATEELVRATFGEEAYAKFAGDDGACPDSLVVLQKQFNAIVYLTRQQFEVLKRRIANWRERVRCGDVEFGQAREAWFMEELRAFSSIADLLNDTFDRFYKQGGVFLSKPRSIIALVNHKNEAQKTLASWQSPEWEVQDMRAVTWNKEQTRYLLNRLASRE